MATSAVKVMAGVAKDISPLYYRILSKFPQNFTFCFAYGSAVKPQMGNQNKQNMIDLIYCVDNSYRWHGANISVNPSHYSALRFLGKGFIARFQENWGAKVYFNTLVDIKEENILIKYGVVSQKDLIADLLDWNDLYLAGRLHKPIEIIKHTNSSQLQNALQSNLRSAVHTALLTLPETFSEYDFYFAISNLSYAGDFRMTFGENKNKVRNIVQPQLLSFRELYRPILQQFHAYVDITTGDAQCHQDINPETKLHHLMQLPMVPQQKIVKFWNHGGPQQDMEDVLRAVAYDIDCAIILRQILKDIVWQSSVRQSLKGINMLSDESSSDSETGRFKGRTKTQEEQTSNQRSDNRDAREAGRSRHAGNDRFSRSFDRRKEDRDHFDKRARDRERDRHRYSRHSPISRRKPSRDRSPNRRSHDRNKHRDSSDRAKYREHRSSSKDRHKRSSGSRSNIPHDNRKDPREDTRRSTRDKSVEKTVKKSSVEKSVSPGHRGKRSEVYRPPPLSVEKKVTERKKSDSPIIIDENDHSDTEDVQLGSYYNMIPAVVKEKSKSDSSEIDSSDDERLRAKLLNLEKELHKTKKQKKHKRKHKRKSSKSSKDRELQETSVSVEVSSTTDIDMKADVPNAEPEVEEVSSTQRNAQKESCEEGEISSDDNSQIDIDPTDLRHKLRRTNKEEKPKEDVCGPALPPHLQQTKRSVSPEIEGPALPPHLQRSKNIGPSIPDDLRKVLAEREVIQYESSDEDSGIGPLPAGSEEKWSDAHRRLEERALDIKIKNLDGTSESKVKSREKWMLKLPEGKAKIIGLEARSFRAKAGPDMSDRSSWTDTPEEKARKAAGEMKEEDIDLQLKQEARIRHIANRDEEQESAVKKHKKKYKREESLLEMHQKKLKKKKKKEEKEDGKKERRPFSRDVDLQVNRFDEAQKKSIIKKAQDLNSRFGRGEAKYL